MIGCGPVGSKHTWIFHAPFTQQTQTHIDMLIKQKTKSHNFFLAIESHINTI